MRDVLASLRALNFADLLRIDHADPSKYSFREYLDRGREHPSMLGYCTSCEQAGFQQANDGSGYRLGIVSHGAHSADYVESFVGSQVDTTHWKTAGVLFVFESPSVDYQRRLHTVEYDGQTKRPIRTWYWIDCEQELRGYPDSFRGATYGTLVRSSIVTFQLANAYVTNLVKCGLNDPPAEKFRGIGAFQDGCVRLCFDRFLSREIELIRPRVAFAFGSAVYNWLVSLVGDSMRVQQLPHPAGKRRGFRDEHYEVLYLWLMARALVAEQIISVDEAHECLTEFLQNAPRRSAGGLTVG